jgi:hypothetical protein
LVIYDTSTIREPPKVSYVLKLMGKHFIDPKRGEIRSVFKVVRRKLPFFGPKLLPALFIKKPRYPCPFEILAEALHDVANETVDSLLRSILLKNHLKKTSIIPNCKGSTTTPVPSSTEREVAAATSTSN